MTYNLCHAKMMGGDMDSGLISKIEKARIYSKEPKRIVLGSFNATFAGNHDEYTVNYEDGAWDCSCNFFVSRGLCSHTIATQRIMSEMLPGRYKRIHGIEDDELVSTH